MLSIDQSLFKYKTKGGRGGGQKNCPKLPKYPKRFLKSTTSNFRSFKLQTKTLLLYISNQRLRRYHLEALHTKGVKKGQKKSLKPSHGLNLKIHPRTYVKIVIKILRCRQKKHLINLYDWIYVR